MAVPTIPSAIALTDIQTEFGGSNPIAINEYYAGGTYVSNPTANSTGTNIPTTGQIAFSNFSGAVGVTGYPALQKAFSVATVDIGTVTASCRWGGLGSAANIWQAISFTSCNVNAYNWTTLPPTSTYDLRVTKTAGGGTLSGITNNAWTRMNANITVSLTRSLVGVITTTANCAIKYNANSTIIDSNICLWTAERKF